MELVCGNCKFGLTDPRPAIAGYRFSACLRWTCSELRFLRGRTCRLSKAGV